MATKRTYKRYRFRGSVIRVFDGDNVPGGAEVIEAPKEERAKPAAPENKAKQAAPANRATKKAD